MCYNKWHCRRQYSLTHAEQTQKLIYKGKKINSKFGNFRENGNPGYGNYFWKKLTFLGGKWHFWEKIGLFSLIFRCRDVISLFSDAIWLLGIISISVASVLYIQIAEKMGLWGILGWFLKKFSPKPPKSGIISSFSKTPFLEKPRIWKEICVTEEFPNAGSDCTYLAFCISI